jgi:transposase
MDSQDDLIERIRNLSEENRKQAEQIKRLEEELARIKQLLAAKAISKTSKRPVFKENYSLDQNVVLKKKSRHRSTGRRPQEVKRGMIGSEFKIYPADVDPEKCVLHREQFAWRIIDGQAVYVGYQIYDLLDSRFLPLPPGLRTSRSEFGIEIILIVAFLHYWIGISLDHACEVLQFFTKLKLSKSQADSLLNQLSSDWDEQYDTIASLIALQMIVYIDETGWKVGKKSCYTWVFSTTMHVLFRCGVSREKIEATKVLGESFAGIGVTDDYAAYKNLFTEHQLCWAHLIRKAIKLALQYPDQPEYAAFLDELCETYHQALRYQRDGRLSVGREAKAQQLLDRLRQLCTRHGEPIIPDETPAHLADFIRLQNELMDQPGCLFVFVQHPEVEATNNRSERNARREAEIRKGARTSKTNTGAQRRGVILSVLASLATRFQRFTLDHLLSEVTRWWDTGLSIFQLELNKLHQPNAPPQ